jgi:hypothetical protein
MGWYMAELRCVETIRSRRVCSRKFQDRRLLSTHCVIRSTTVEVSGSEQAFISFVLAQYLFNSEQLEKKLQPWLNIQDVPIGLCLHVFHQRSNINWGNYRSSMDLQNNYRSSIDFQNNYRSSINPTPFSTCA